MDESHESGMGLVFFVAVAATMVIAVIGVALWLQNNSLGAAGLRFDAGIRMRVTVDPQREAEASGPAAETDAEAAPAGPSDAALAAIDKGGCIACHEIPGVPNAIGQVGPSLVSIGLDAADRREGYSAEEYIHESLAEPLAFAAPECPTGPCIAGTMPVLQLSDDEIETIVEFLVTLGVEE